MNLFKIAAGVLLVDIVAAIELPLPSGLRNFLSDERPRNPAAPWHNNNNHRTTDHDNGQGAGKTCTPMGNGPGEHQDCPGNLWCKLNEAGQCPNGEHTGKCEPVPMFCNRMLLRVCGCDGKAYDNYSCTFGVNIVHDGPCSTVAEAEK